MLMDNNSSFPTLMPTAKPSDIDPVGFTFKNHAAILVIGCIAFLMLSVAVAVVVIRMWLFEEVCTAPACWKRKFGVEYEDFERRSCASSEDMQDNHVNLEEYSPSKSVTLIRV